MKSIWKSTLGIIALATSLSAVAVRAQNGPPGGPDQGRPQGGDMMQGGGPGGGGPGGGGPDGGPGGGGPGGAGQGGDRPPRMDGTGNGPPRPAVTPEQRRSEAMRGYLELVERYAKLASDPDAAAIAAILTGTDLVRPQGPEAIAEYLEGLLKETRRPTVQTAIRLQLIDVYKQSRDTAKAMAHVRALVVDGAAATSTAPAKP